MCHRNVKVVLARVMTSSAFFPFIHFYVSINIKSNNFWLATFTVSLNSWMTQWKEDAFTYYFYVNKLWATVFLFYFHPHPITNELLLFILRTKFQISGKYLGSKSPSELINLYEVGWIASDGVINWVPPEEDWDSDLTTRRLLGNALDVNTFGGREGNRMAQREKVTLI